MKRRFILSLVLSVFVLTSVPVSAYEGNNSEHSSNKNYTHYEDKDQHYKHRYDNDNEWHHSHRNDNESERSLPFRWHERYDSMRDRYQMHRLHGHEWNKRFPGVHVYSWSGPGFWHHGRYVTKALLFFNDDNRLVSIGYMSQGVFIHVREDHHVYESHDSFFLSRWGH